jgi:pimeloyl-ACP methyl ester carboxylesterase
MTIDGIYINYVRYGLPSSKTIVLLHGWGQNIEMMKPIGDNLKKTNDIIILDLPGYGKSSEPNYAYTVFDYADLIHKFLDELNVKNPILIGHSFGGKISLYYASKYNVDKLILLASPYCPEIEKMSLKVKILKKLKKVPILNKFENFFKKHIGSEDYKKATPIMREILVKTVNLNLKEYVSKINCPTLLIWGTNDTAVPLKRAYELEKLIKDAGVVTYEGGTHYAYLEFLYPVVNVIKTFLR